MENRSTMPVQLLTACLAAACLASAASAMTAPDPGPPLQDWPRITGPFATDPTQEARIGEILAGMTLAQKIGQMTQPEIKSITPDEVRRYHIGSVLNGGGSWPGADKHASVADWLRMAQAYHDASMATGAAVPIPVIWGTDAVHGHNNVFGATLFPHNIGLGAAHDPELVERIGEATARATRATGIHWVFAPTLAVAQDPRWGRTYESFSSDGEQVREYAAAYIRGLQGRLDEDGDVVATAKHFIGDGATDSGKDQGVARVSFAEMVDVHGQGYYGALGAGVQTVMASFNSWNDVDAGVDYGKMHGAGALLTGALKEKMGFDGFVVSDWNGINQVPGCSNASCPRAIVAGVDMVMVPEDWKAFIANTQRQVETGEIPMARIDDAVRRILRVKLRAGLFDRRPTDGRHAGDKGAIVHRDLARRAVRESLVLLKNEDGLLPLKPGRRVLVVGKSADSLSNQAGGWSLTWQGTENVNADYANAESLLAGLRAALGTGNVAFSETGAGADPATFDVVVAIVGETPYAEMNGDILEADTLAHSRRHPEDLAVLEAAAKTGKPVATVFLSGRPLYANDLINRSQAFVAAWLPGSEGGGVADVLVAGADGTPRHDFHGRLSFAWPADPCPAAANRPDPRRPPLFGRGYGLGYDAPGTVATLPERAPAFCAATTTLALFNTLDITPFALQLQAGAAEQALGSDLNATLRWPQETPAVEVRTVQINTQQDARQVTWLAPARVRSYSATPVNLEGLADADAALVFDVVGVQRPMSPVRLAMDCGTGCRGEIDISPWLADAALGAKTTLKVPLACFAQRGTRLAAVEAPFVLEADAPFAVSFTNVRIVAGAAKDADARACAPTAAAAAAAD